MFQAPWYPAQTGYLREEVEEEQRDLEDAVDVELVEDGQEGVELVEERQVELVVVVLCEISGGGPQRVHQSDLGERLPEGSYSYLSRGEPPTSKSVKKRFNPTHEIRTK